MPLGTTRAALPLASRAVPLLSVELPEAAGHAGQRADAAVGEVMVPLVTGLPLASRTETVRVETGMVDVVGLALVQCPDGQGGTGHCSRGSSGTRVR